jgi:hypothetical protein
MQAPRRNSPGASNVAPLPFLSDSNTNDVAVPLATKIKRKLDLNPKQNFVKKSAMFLVRARVRGEHDFSHKREMVGRNPRQR